MALLEALSPAELLSYLMYDTTIISSGAATPFITTATTSLDSSDTTTLIPENNANARPEPHQQGEDQEGEEEEEGKGAVLDSPQPPARNKVVTRGKFGDNANGKRSAGNCLGVQGGARKKRKRRPRVCKNKEEAENQRMTHIAVERNRRKQMNEHLAVLRSLMPDSYVQRGDQASVVGGAIEFVKELEHLLQCLEAQRLRLIRGGESSRILYQNNDDEDQKEIAASFTQAPFSQFFLYPQFTCSQLPNKFAASSLTSKASAAVADIEVTLIETHANVRILWRRNPKHLSKLVTGFHSLHLTILHLSVIALDPLVLYSVSAKVEEGCQLTSVDDIAGAVHHMLRIIEEGSELCCS